MVLNYLKDLFLDISAEPSKSHAIDDSSKKLIVDHPLQAKHKASAIEAEMSCTGSWASFCSTAKVRRPSDQGNGSWRPFCKDVVKTKPSVGAARRVSFRAFKPTGKHI